jgi:hypothetical protein
MSKFVHFSKTWARNGTPHHTSAKSLRSDCPCLFTGIMRGFGVGNTAVAALVWTWMVDPLRSHKISPVNLQLRFVGLPNICVRLLIEEPRDPQNIFCVGGIDNFDPYGFWFLQKYSENIAKPWLPSSGLTWFNVRSDISSEIAIKWARISQPWKKWMVTMLSSYLEDGS